MKIPERLIVKGRDFTAKRRYKNQIILGWDNTGLDH